MKGHPGLWLVAMISWAGVAAPCAAQTSGEFAGRWLLVSSERPIARAIDRVVARMDFFARGFARSALADRIRAERRISFTVHDAYITSRLGQSGPYDTPIDGRPVFVTGPDGNRNQLSTWLLRDRLVQQFVSPDGVRTNTYVLEDGGRTLRARVRITSPRLPEAIDYELVYRQLSDR